jgi:hypothetical protein
VLVFKRLKLFNAKFMLKENYILIKNYMIVGNIIFNLFKHLKKEFPEKTVIDSIEFALIDLLSELSYFDFNIVYEEPYYAEKLFSKKIREFFLKELISLDFIEKLNLNEEEKEKIANKFKKNRDIVEILEFYNSIKYSKNKAIEFYYYLKKEIFGYFENKNEFIFEIIERERSKEFSIKSYLAFALFYNLELPKKVLLDYFNSLFLEKKEEIEKESEEFSLIVENFYNLLIYELEKDNKKELDKKRKESIEFLLNLK